MLYRNNGKGDFTRITEGNVVADGGCSHQGAWGDYDNDGDLNLAVANLGFPDGEKNYLYENQGGGRFERVENGTLVNDVEASSGVAWADYDGNGFLDAFVANGVAGENSTHRGGDVQERRRGFLRRLLAALIVR